MQRTYVILIRSMTKLLPKIFLAIFLVVGLSAPLKIAASSDTYGQCVQECNRDGLTNCHQRCEGLPGETACGLLGCSELGIDIGRFDDLNILGIISLIAGLVFTVIIIIGVFYVVRGAIKIVRSEGDPSKIEEGTKMFKGVYIGLFMILGGILGFVLVLALFNSGSTFDLNPELPPIP